MLFFTYIHIECYIFVYTIWVFFEEIVCRTVRSKRKLDQGILFLSFPSRTELNVAPLKAEVDFALHCHYMHCSPLLPVWPYVLSIILKSSNCKQHKIFFIGIIVICFCFLPSYMILQAHTKIHFQLQLVLIRSEINLNKTFKNVLM